jgi:hypothetical protein
MLIIIKLLIYFSKFKLTISLFSTSNTDSKGEIKESQKCL